MLDLIAMTRSGSESTYACPQCRGPVLRAATADGWKCLNCRLLFPISDGIPNFLLEDAEPLDDTSLEPTVGSK